MPDASVARSMARRITATARVVAHAARVNTTATKAAVGTLSHGHLKKIAALVAATADTASVSASVMPFSVGRSLVPTRNRIFDPPCSSSSTRASSQPQRPTATLTSRSARHPSSMSTERAGRAERSTPASSDSTASCVVQRSCAPVALFGADASEQSAGRHDVGHGWHRRLPRESRHPIGFDHRRRIQHAADTAVEAGDRLDEVHPRDQEAMTQRGGAPVGRRQPRQIRTPPEEETTRDGDQPAERPQPEEKRRQHDIARQQRAGPDRHQRR